MRLFILALVWWVALPALGAPHSSWSGYMKTNRYKCPGPFDTLSKPTTLDLAGKKYTHEGYRLVVKDRDEDTKVKIGVISAIKDTSDGTKKNFADAIAWFKKEGVEWVVSNGDLALEEFDLEEVIDMLGRTGMPTVITIGNSESRGSWARVYRDRAAKYPNLINGVWVRQIVADDLEMWTMPGYHDKAFVHQGAGCKYTAEDVAAMGKSIKAEGKAPLALIAHGPPKGKGSKAIDFILDKKNVGDPELNKLIDKAGITLGIFGHILEAGGRAVGKDHASPVAEGKLSSHLHINAGSLSGDPWALNDGTTSRGMAILVSVDGQKASYQVRRFTADD